MTDPRFGAEDAATDYWDGNWIDVEVEIESGAFRGRYRADLRTDEVRAFRDQLQALYESLKGEACLESMENWLTLKVVAADQLGHLRVEGEARDEPGMGNRLTFRLEVDQTEVQAVLSGLERVLQEFPVVGKQ